MNYWIKDEEKFKQVTICDWFEVIKLNQLYFV